MGWLKSILSALGSIFGVLLWFLKRSDVKKPERLRNEVDAAISKQDVAKEQEILERGLNKKRT